eukprot:TRINITY_DN9797_c0_g1_i2.p3 TRINITY_DN9797_c0_g1~~TRINITY_DN9797_c0_g1_i2.p3  ORF type:complete len:105 (-),score=1.13 TRINITY_DN9797_c0_g1_i2:107-421(-)
MTTDSCQLPQDTIVTISGSALRNFFLLPQTFSRNTCMFLHQCDNLNFLPPSTIFASDFSNVILLMGFWGLGSIFFTVHVTFDSTSLTMLLICSTILEQYSQFID